MAYYGADLDGFHLPFNFHLIRAPWRPAAIAALVAEYEAALETLVGALRRQEAGEISAEEMSLITAGMEHRFGLTEGQTAVLGRAADALRAEREQIGRLATLVAIGHESRVRLAEQDLLRRAVRRVADGFGGDGVRVGLLGGGHCGGRADRADRPAAAHVGGRRGLRAASSGVGGSAARARIPPRVEGRA